MPTPTRLINHVAEMVALEQMIAQQIEGLLNEEVRDPEVVALLEDLQELTHDHQQALAVRVQAISPDAAVPDACPAASTRVEWHDRARYPASAALVDLYALLQRAVIGYSVLVVLARRAADSSVRGADNTDDLVQQHMRHTTAAVQSIARLLPGVVIAESEQEGQVCQCTCPSCALGLCLCAVSTRRTLEMAWADAGPVYIPEPISMVLPRPESAAALAGLERGDVVLAVDGIEIGSIPALQQAIRGHQPGEEVHFQVQRASGERREVTVVRP